MVDGRDWYRGYLDVSSCKGIDLPKYRIGLVGSRKTDRLLLAPLFLRYLFWLIAVKTSSLLCALSYFNAITSDFLEC